MLVVAAFFGVWTFTKPLIVPDEAAVEETKAGEGH